MLMPEPTRKSFQAFERELAIRSAELAEERAYRDAISDILRVISASPTDVQPVFDTIAQRAKTLCGAGIGIATRFDGELIHVAATPGMSAEASETRLAAFPMKANRSSLSGRTILEGVPVEIPDTLADSEYLMHAATTSASQSTARRR